MSVKYGKFEIPEKIKLEKSEDKGKIGRFVAEPFERGFGHTVGNSLRRMLLSSLEAPAIISVRIEGVPHEYMAIDGVVEDMTNIILNLKGALLRLRAGAQEKHMGQQIVTSTLEVTAEQLSKGGQKAVTLGDLFPDGLFELVNPDLHLFSVTQPMKKQVFFRVAVGRGYVPSERMVIPDKIVDEIGIDALFSPVRVVSYRVENTRVGQDTDFDKLVIDVQTDGRVTPHEALSFAAQIGKRHLDVFESVDDREISFEQGESVADSDREEMLAKLAQRIGEIELSVRSTNCLNQAGIQTIGELVVIREQEMLQFRNFGKKSLTEIKKWLEKLDLGFGMDLSEYGISRDNVRDVVEQYVARRAAEEVTE